MPVAKQQKSSFFDCKACGNQQKNEQVYVDVTQKKPVSAMPSFTQQVIEGGESKQIKSLNTAPPTTKTTTDTKILNKQVVLPTAQTTIVNRQVVRPTSVFHAPRNSIIRTLVRPKIIFNYMTPETIIVTDNTRLSQSLNLKGKEKIQK